jgi:hypothetical protein
MDSRSMSLFVNPGACGPAKKCPSAKIHAVSVDRPKSLSARDLTSRSDVKMIGDITWQVSSEKRLCRDNSSKRESFMINRMIITVSVSGSECSGRLTEVK